MQTFADIQESITGGAPVPPVLAGFEEPDYRLGNIHHQRGWTVEQGVAEVVAGLSHSGKAHLRLAPNEPFSQAKLKLAATVPPSSVTFVDCWVRPVAVDAQSQGELLDIDGARVAFFKNPEAKNEGEFYVFDATPAQPTWLPTGVRVAIDEASGLAKDWIRLTVREDFVRQVWDLRVNGKWAGANLSFVEPLVSHTENYIIMGEATESVLLDDLRIDTQNPLGKDVDTDGVTDAEEKLVGSKPLFDDRDVDIDKDGVSDVLRALANGEIVIKAPVLLPLSPVFSRVGGLLDGPFTLSLSAGVDQSIIYTLDGSDPRKNRRTAAKYTNPLEISRTTVVRACAVDKIGRISPSVSRVWLDLAAVADQKMPSWANAFLEDFTRVGKPLRESLSWEMKTGEAGGLPSKVALLKSLKSAPIVALVGDPDEWFGPGKGMYSAASKRLSASAAVHCFNGAENIAVETAVAGISGESSRFHDVTVKHSLRVKFANAESLTGDVLGDNLAAGQLLLRHPTHDSWTASGIFSKNKLNAKYFADSLGGALMEAAGNQALSRRWVHVFINENYWGAYEAIQQSEPSAVASLLEGGPTFQVEAIYGDTNGWKALRKNVSSLVSANLLGTDHSAIYDRIVDQLDEQCLIDYMIVNSWLTNLDWPEHNYLIQDNGGKISFLSWDCEWSLRPSDGLVYDMTRRFSSAPDGPAWLFTQLCQYAPFRDLVKKRWAELSGEGRVFHPQTLLSIAAEVRSEFDLLKVAEAARWGDRAQKDNGLGNHAKLVAWLNDEYIPKRTAVIGGHFTKFLEGMAAYEARNKADLAARKLLGPGVDSGNEVNLSDFKTDRQGDWDGDGIPDIWEKENGLNPYDANDAGLDGDNDGLSNREEYFLGKDVARKDEPLPTAKEPTGLHSRAELVTLRKGQNVERTSKQVKQAIR